MPSMAKIKKRSAPSPNPQGVQSLPDLSQQFRLDSKSAQRAKTFPTPINTSGTPRDSMSYDGPSFRPKAGLEANFRQPFHDMVSPTTMSAGGTPDSSTTSNSGQQQPYNIQQSFGNNNGPLPDIGPMMFPSADPFAYPNQPMMEFDNRQQKQELVDSMMSDGPSDMFLTNNNDGLGGYDNLEGQLFGPLPPYLMQSQAHLGIGGQMNMGGGDLGNLNAPDISGYAGIPPAGLSFDEIFAGNNDEWAGMLSGDQGYRQ